jgi:hypothetical protein
LVEIQSQLTPANVTAPIIYMDYNLSSWVPDGPWEQTIKVVPGPQS